MLDVEAWLSGLGLAQYAASFRANDIDAATLASLTAEDLKEIGVSSVGHRRKLLDAIARLNEPAGRLPARQAAGQEDERRQVTVLFADLSDFTALSKNLGAEQSRALLNRYFATVDEIVASYGGSVDKHIGDSVMAVFGAPTAHTDDPERAVRAAFAIHCAIAALSKTVGLQLKAHVGIASGQVVAGVTGSDRHTEYTMTGDSVNLASRLNDLAETGETLVSDAVQRTTSRIAAYARRGEASVKGFAQPIPIWVALELLPEPAADSLTPFVGRRAELAQFCALLAEAPQGRGHCILVRGEPGIGKSRLLDRFAELAAAQGFRLHKALVLDFGVARGQDAVRTLARSLLALPAESDEASRGLVADRAQGITPGNRVFLNDLLDLAQPPGLRSLYESMDATARRAGVWETVGQLIVTKARETPLLLSVEDVHWADPITFEGVAAMAATVGDLPVLLVLTSRVEGRTLQQEWVSTLGGTPLTTMELQPLKEDEARQLARDLVVEPSGNLDDYVARAEGNPLFLEQLTRSAVGRSSELPDTLQGLVLARMDRLEPRDRLALRSASVLGQRFTLEGLRFLMNDKEYDGSALLKHQLVRPEGAGYLFAHALIRDGVYASLLVERRQALHARAADWFEDKDLPLHATHLDRAGKPSAAGAYLAAAREQAGEARFEPALQLVERGLELAPSAESFELNLLRGELLRHLASIGESIAAYERALAVASGGAERCRALIGVAEGLRLRDRHSELQIALVEAERAAAAQGLKAELARIHQLQGSVHFVRGEVQDCLRVHTASLALAREAGSAELEAQALGGLGEAEFARGRMISAFHHYDRCIALGQANGLARVVAANLSMRGQTLAFMNDLAAAMSDCRAGVELASRIRQPRAEMIAGIVAAYILDLTDAAEGERWATASLAIARRLGAQLFESINLEFLGRFAAQLGRPAEAVALVQDAIQILRRSDSGMRFLACRALGALALVTSDPDRQAAALQEGEAVLRSGVPAFNHFWFNRDAIEVSLQRAAWDDVEKFASMLEAFTRDEPLPWSRFFVARGRALAAFSQGRHDGAQVLALERLREEARRAGLNQALLSLESALAVLERQTGR